MIWLFLLFMENVLKAGFGLELKYLYCHPRNGSESADHTQHGHQGKIGSESA